MQFGSCVARTPASATHVTSEPDRSAPIDSRETAAQQNSAAGWQSGGGTGAQVADRMSKGIREAPTKALMGELAAKSDDRPEQAFGARAPFWAPSAPSGET